ncbi:SDR family NAD(P)-dependent oxidoreductase [Algirhabdus cladophorae]|uniref:SDR family NAD(P)-dependent oxidoreductase n=1 Tax=Algirhabdus cladophorae TaxID=3377108 RepID=UPI003B845AA4
MNSTWVILGATSSMARAFARQLSERGEGVILAGRDMNDLQATASDCTLRGAPVAKAMAFDARKPETFQAILDVMADQDGALNAAVFVGSMPEQADIDADPSMIDGVIQDSFTGPATFLQALAPMMEDRDCGTVIGVGSVAGDRGRIGNYVYGAAKAGFHTYLSGLRNRLNRSGGHVMTVKPGFVDTSMTWGLEGMFLVASPDEIATSLLKGVKKKTNVLYTPFFWRYIMRIIKSIPEPLFKKLSV